MVCIYIPPGYEMNTAGEIIYNGPRKKKLCDNCPHWFYCDEAGRGFCEWDDE